MPILWDDSGSRKIDSGGWPQTTGTSVCTSQPVPQEANAVGKRRDPIPAVLVVQSLATHTQGVHFYHSGPLFLTEGIPAKFLSLLKGQSA